MNDARASNCELDEKDYIQGIDDKFERNAKQCHDADMPFGIYWFGYACAVKMAKNEASMLLLL